MLFARSGVARGPHHAIQDQRGGTGEGQLRRRERRPRRAGREGRQDQAECRDGGQRGQRTGDPFDPEVDHPVAQCSHQDAQADHSITDDHESGEHRVPGQGRCVIAAGHHQRDDQSDFDDGHRHRQDQRPERFPDAVGHDFGMVDGRDHRRHQPHSHQCQQRIHTGRATPGRRQHECCHRRYHKAPAWKRALLGDHHIPRLPSNFASP